jgi:hypothetical protein
MGTINLQRVFVESRGDDVSDSVEIVLKKCRDGLFKATVRVRNLTALELPRVESRADSLTRSFVSAHTIFGAEGGNRREHRAGLRRSIACLRGSR